MASEPLEQTKSEGEYSVENKEEVISEEKQVSESEIEPNEKGNDESDERTDEVEAKVEIKEKDDDVEEGENEECESVKDDSESEDVTKEKELAIPNSERPTRERKMVERYSEHSVVRSSAGKSLSIEKGRGIQLKDIPNVAYKLSKRKPDETLQTLHKILFGKKVKAYSLKRNIGQFSGYVWLENEREKHKTKVREKLDKCTKEKLIDFCDVLNIPINKTSTRKEEISAKILDFLEFPHSTTEILLADRPKKAKSRTRKPTPSKRVSPGSKSTEAPTKKQKCSTQVNNKQRGAKNVEEEDEICDNVESPETKYDSDEDSDKDMMAREENGDESEEEEEGSKPKSQVSSKKGSSKKELESSAANEIETPEPAKSKKIKRSSGSTSIKGASDAGGTATSPSQSKGYASKKQKNEKESPKVENTLKEKVSKKQSSKSPRKIPLKNEGKGKGKKKAKTEPTREDLHAAVVDLLKEVDFNKTTLSDILKQLGEHFEVDLMQRKLEVKEVITEVINSMSDVEDDEEESVEDGDQAGSDDEDKDREDAD